MSLRMASVLALIATPFAAIYHDRPQSSTEFSELRERLAALASTESNDELLYGYWTLLANHGVAPVLIHGEVVVIDHGVQLMLEDSRSAGAWVLRSRNEETVELPLERWIRFVSPEGVRAQVPRQLEGEAAPVVVVSTGDVLLMVSLQTGLMRRIPFSRT